MRGDAFTPVPSRGMITISIMLANIMQGLDNTILNVALPHIQGSLSASLDQVAWALTSYKLVCGFLGARLGVLTTVIITEGATAAGILALLPVPLGVALALLPIIGVALNGTSSVLYGTVPELVSPERRESAFGVFSTGTIGAGALAPALYGLLSDAIGLNPAMLLLALVVLLTLPLAWQLSCVLRAVASSPEPQTVR